MEALLTFEWDPLFLFWRSVTPGSISGKGREERSTMNAPVGRSLTSGVPPEAVAHSRSCSGFISLPASPGHPRLWQTPP